MWLATGSLLTVCLRMLVSGAELAPLLNPLFCEWARLHVRDFPRKVIFFFFFFFSAVIPQFGLLSHVSSLRLSSGHSGPVLTLSTGAAARLLVVDASIWATSLMTAAVRCVFCRGFFLPVMLRSEILKLPTDTPVRGFPTVWKLLLLHKSLPRTGLCP